MRKNIIIALLLFSSNITLGQKFNFKLVDKLVKISFVSIDEFMSEGYGFKKIKNNKNEDEKHTRTYVRVYENNRDKIIIIKVLSPNNKPNILDIYLGKSFNLRDIKDKLISMNYEYNGNNKFGYNVYQKDKSTYLFAKKPNKVGATHLIINNE